MKLDAYASLPHYLDHLAPVWRALPEELRGELHLPPTLIPRAEERRLEDARPLGEGTSPLALVASYNDLAAYTGGGRQRVVLMEHGAGQSYGGDPQPEVNRHPAYAGGRNRDDVVLFLNPGEHPAERNADAYPAATSVAVGSPRVDELRRREPVTHEPTVAFTWHYNAQVCPETGGVFADAAVDSFTYWRDSTLDVLAGSGFRLLAHAHPRAVTDVFGYYDMRRGVEYVEEFETLVDEADVLVGDNSSALYEWAALGRPVVALNHPGWRRSVRHGLRFWDAIPGRPVDTLAEFEDAMAAILPNEHLRTEPLPAARAAYAHLDGTAASRCVEAVQSVLTVTGARAS